jgi:hypothetical protein
MKPPRPEITPANYAQFQSARAAAEAIISRHYQAKLARIRAENAARCTSDRRLTK